MGNAAFISGVFFFNPTHRKVAQIRSVVEILKPYYFKA